MKIKKFGKIKNYNRKFFRLDKYRIYGILIMELIKKKVRFVL